MTHNGESSTIDAKWLQTILCSKCSDGGERKGGLTWQNVQIATELTFHPLGTSIPDLEGRISNQSLKFSMRS